MTGTLDPCRLMNAQWLTQGPLAKLLAVLDRDGEEARVVGGAVRNALLGQAPGDVDIATTALPEEILRRVEAAGFKAVASGIDHGTVTIVVEGTPFEVTTLREDIETFGRKARVRFGRDWQVDAQRRDFTVNAFSIARDGTIHDYVGGMADLEGGIIRFIGDPATRIAEDTLRVLRFFRFHAAYGRGAPDAAALHACIAAISQLDTLSRERVRAEFLKLLLAAGAVPTLAIMAESGLLGWALGGVPLMTGLAHMVALEVKLGLAPDAMRRLGALNVLIVEDAERLQQRLRLSNAEYDRLASMADHWWLVDPGAGDAAARTLLYRFGAERFIDRVLLAWARSGAKAADASWREVATLAERWTAPVFPLKAADLMARGVPKGPQLGSGLAAAEAAWIAAGFPDDDATLKRIADQAAAQCAESSV